MATLTDQAGTIEVRSPAATQPPPTTPPPEDGAPPGMPSYLPILIAGGAAFLGLLILAT